MLAAAVAAFAGHGPVRAGGAGTACAVESLRADGGAPIAGLHCTEGFADDLPWARQPPSFARPPAPEPAVVDMPGAPARRGVPPGTDLRADVRRGNLFRTDQFFAGRWIPPSPALTAVRARADRPSLVPGLAVPAAPTPRHTLVPPPGAFEIPDFRMPGAATYDPARGARRLYLDGTPGF